MARSMRFAAYRFGSFTLDIERGALLGAAGEDMPLRPKSFTLLCLLVENAGRLVTKETIMGAVWPDVYVTEDNITQCIHDIRTALGAESNQIIRTLPRRGYMLTGDVVAGEPSGPVPAHDGIDHRGQTAFMPPVETKSGTEAATTESDTSEPGGHRSASSPQMPPRKPQRLSVMVVPFRNLGIPAEHRYLAESIPDDIANDISQYPAVLVVDSPEALRRRDQSADPRDVARALGAGYVIQGSIRGIADRLAVNVQLIDVESGVRRASERFDIDLPDIADTLNEVTSKAAISLLMRCIEHANQCVEAIPPEDRSQDDLVARGLALIHRPVNIRTGPDPHRQEALKCFERALAGAPDSIPAKIGIASVLVTDIAVGYRPRLGSEEARTEQLLAEILSVDGTIGLAHTLLGLLRQSQWRLDDSLVELRIAAALLPNHPPTIGMHGTALAYDGQPEAAIPLLEWSLRLAPHNYYAPVSRGFLGLCHLLLGDTEQAIVSLKTAVAMNPRVFLFHAWLAAARGLHGELHEARAALRQALDMFPGLVEMVSLIRLANPAYVALFERTVYPGLVLAGLPDVLAKNQDG